MVASRNVMKILFSVFCLMFCLGNTVFADTPSEVVNVVESSAVFNLYPNIDRENKKILEITDNQGNVVKYIFQYSVDTPYSEEIPSRISGRDITMNLSVSISSLLLIGFDVQTNTIETILVDYSLLEREGTVTIINLDTNASVKLAAEEISPELVELWEEMSFNKSSLVIETEEEIRAQMRERSVGRPCMYWVCTKHKEGGGKWHDGCSQLGSFLCQLVGKKLSYVGNIVCSGAVLVGCYIPSYRVCMDGYWETRFCPN
ncbi:TPA: hypothetical protein U1V77_000241 [Streptococcus suis]|nr:hypothetical protein [Streptococcus suis]